ncbi:MAG: universal stress protein [Halobacteriota archaeon]
MSESDVRVLVPIAILEGEAIPESVIDILGSVDVVLLGYHVIPDQTATAQAHEQFQEKANAELREWADQFETGDGDVETHLVFTHDRDQTIERIAVETETDSILRLNPAPAIDRVLIPIRGEINLDRICEIAARVTADTDTELVVFHAAADEGTREDKDAQEGRDSQEGSDAQERSDTQKGNDAQEGSDARENETPLLDRVESRLEAAGVDPTRITQQLVVTDEPIDALLSAADEVDFVIMGEDKPSIRELVFGETSERVAESSIGPVLVVRRLVEPQ